LREQDGGETRASVLISASDMRDENIDVKKRKGNNEVDKKDKTSLVPDSMEMEIEEKQTKQIKNKNPKLSSQSKIKSPLSKSSSKQDQNDLDSILENNNDKLTANEKQETPEVEKKEKTIIKKQHS
jgi:hypothetical protein